jgi:hypothetical protein
VFSRQRSRLGKTTEAACQKRRRCGEPPSLVGNTIMHCTYQFQDAALRSLAWLHGLWVMGEKDVVNGFIREIKTDAPPSGSQKLH